MTGNHCHEGTESAGLAAVVAVGGSTGNYDVAAALAAVRDLAADRSPAGPPIAEIRRIVADHPVTPCWETATPADHAGYRRVPGVAPLAAAPWRGMRILFGIDLDHGGPTHPTVWMLPARSPAGTDYRRSPTRRAQQAMLTMLGAELDGDACGVLTGPRPAWCAPDWWATATRSAGV